MHSYRLFETLLLSTQNICFGLEIKKIIFQYALLSGGLEMFNICLVIGLPQVVLVGKYMLVYTKMGDGLAATSFGVNLHIFIMC